MWEDKTWEDYRLEIHNVARALMAVGFEQADSVSILGWNSPEWFAAALGAIFAGGMAAGVYTTNSADGLSYIVQHSRSKVLFVDDEVQQTKALAIRERCPLLRCVVFWGAPSSEDPFLRGWNSFQASAVATPMSELQARVAAQKPGGACYLSYTSGTTGNPKAVMLSHDNALFGFRCWFVHGWQGLDMGMDERNVSYLPCSHLAGSVDIFGPLAREDSVHSIIHFAFPDALQGSLEDTLRSVRPTYFCGVPRVWQKLEPSLREAVRGGCGALEARARVGLECSKWQLCGSAPMEHETLRFFQSLGLRLDEIYGMTENTAVALMCNTPHQRLGSIGVPLLPGSVRLVPETNEICTRHRATMMGYMHEPERTRPEFDEAGWLHSGDIGERDADGFYRIVGRIKELIITAGGENIPPVPIETALKDSMPFVSNAVVIGDRQKMLICLFTPKLLANPAGTPMWLPQLALESADVDPNARTAAEACESERWKALLQRGVDAYNETKALSRAQRIRRWALLPCDFVFATADAELTPTLKLRRDVVHRRYATIIKDLYGADFMQVPWATGPRAKM